MRVPALVMLFDVEFCIWKHRKCHNLLSSFALINLILSVSLCVAVAGAVCARSHLEAAFCAEKVQ